MTRYWTGHTAGPAAYTSRFRGVKVVPGVEHLICDRSIRLGNRYIDVWKLIHGDAVVKEAVLDDPRIKVDKAIWWNASST